MRFFMRVLVSVVMLCTLSGCISAYNKSVNDEIMNDPVQLKALIDNQRQQQKKMHAAMGIQDTDPEEFKLNVAGYNLNPDDQQSVNVTIEKKNYRVGVVPFTSTSKGAELDTVQLKEVENFCADALSDIVMNKMQVTLFTRNDLGKIFTEQRLQLTGDFDEKTAVNLGKMVGLTHIITGNINVIETRKGDMARFLSGATQQGFDGKQQAALAAVFNRLSSKTHISVKMLDVQTGKVIFHKNYTGEASTPGDTGEFKSEHYFAVTKDAIKKAILETQYDFANQFPIVTRIIQTRGSKSIALIEVGSANGVNIGDIFDVVQVENINGVESRYNIGTLTLSDQISSNQAWGFIKSVNKPLVKTGMPAVRILRKQITSLNTLLEGQM